MYGLARRQIFSDAEAKRTGQNFEFPWHWHSHQNSFGFYQQCAHKYHVNNLFSTTAKRMNQSSSPITNAVVNDRSVICGWGSASVKCIHRYNHVSLSLELNTWCIKVKGILIPVMLWTDTPSLF